MDGWPAARIDGRLLSPTSEASLLVFAASCRLTLQGPGGWEKQEKNTKQLGARLLIKHSSNWNPQQAATRRGGRRLSRILAALWLIQLSLVLTLLSNRSMFDIWQFCFYAVKPTHQLINGEGFGLGKYIAYIYILRSSFTVYSGCS